MDKNEFIEKVAEQFDDLEGVKLEAATHFRDVDGWSSITALSIIAMVDEEYGVEIGGDDIRTSQTIEDIFKKVVAKRGQ